jgi:hypothetical protein
VRESMPSVFRLSYLPGRTAVIEVSIDALGDCSISNLFLDSLT